MSLIFCHHFTQDGIDYPVLGTFHENGACGQLFTLINVVNHVVVIHMACRALPAGEFLAHYHAVAKHTINKLDAGEIEIKVIHPFLEEPVKVGAGVERVVNVMWHG